MGNGHCVSCECELFEHDVNTNCVGVCIYCNKDVCEDDKCYVIREDEVVCVRCDYKIKRKERDARCWICGESNATECRDCGHLHCAKCFEVKKDKGAEGNTECV